MKSSNPQVWYSLSIVVQKLDAENFKPYPLHLGVKKLAMVKMVEKIIVGIGTLLEEVLAIRFVFRLQKNLKGSAVCFLTCQTLW